MKSNKKNNTSNFLPKGPTSRKLLLALFLVILQLGMGA